MFLLFFSLTPLNTYTDIATFNFPKTYIMTKHLTILLIILSIIGCKKEQENSDCSVKYEIDYSQTATLGHTWKLIGFQQEESTLIEYPPCEGYDYYSQSNSDFEMTISFSDTLQTINDTIIFILPYAFQGKAVFNEYYGSYDTNISNKLTIGPIMSSQMGGSKVLIDYEEKYLAILNQAQRFEIQNNLLTIWCNSTDKILYVLKEDN